MAGVDVGGDGGKKRATNADINMIPFIDLLMVTIAFLLITAVWVTNSRISASANVPGPEKCDENCEQNTSPVLHVTVGENDFGLSWRQAATVISEVHVSKGAGTGSGGLARYDDLAKAIASEWKQRRTHSDPSDRKSDTAVLHSDDKTSFRELVGVLDAINTTQRDYKGGDGRVSAGPAFQTTFAVK